MMTLLRSDWRVATLDFVEGHVREKGYPPTVREVQAALNVGSTATAYRYLTRLVREGRLVRRKVSSGHEVFDLP